MTLPFPTNALVIPVLRYDPASTVIIPDGLTPQPDVAHLVARVSTALINLAGELSLMHPGRTFCYNLLSCRYWNNPQFTELVQLTLDSISLSVAKRMYPMPEQALNDEVSKVLSLYAGTLVFTYTDLASILEPKYRNAAYQNSASIQELKSEIQIHIRRPSTMNQQYYAPPQQYPQQPQPVQYQPQPGQYPPQSMQYQPQPGQYPPQGYQPQPVQYGPQPYPSQYQTQPQMGYTPQQTWVPSPTAQMEIPNPVRQDRFVARPAVHTPVHVEPTPALVPVIPEVTPPVIAGPPVLNKVTVNGGREMDRSKHKIEYFKSTCTAEITARNDALVMDAIKMADTDHPVISEPLHHDVVLAEPSVDDAILSTQIIQLAEHPDIQLFRATAAVVSASVSTTDTSDIRSILSEATGFKSLALKMTQASTGLDLNPNPIAVADGMAYLLKLDAMLCRIINDFALYSLRIDCHIDSFVEDAPGLSDWILRNHTQAHGTALSRKESEIIASLIDFDMPYEEVPSIGKPEHLYQNGICVLWNITSTLLNSRELAYDIGPAQCVIDSLDTPTLYIIAQSICTRTGHPVSIYNVLVTADDRRYHIYQDYIDPSTFYIHLAV